MLALIVSRSCAVRDGLVALLEATLEIDIIVQSMGVQSAWNLVQDVNPDITLVYIEYLTQDLATFIANLNSTCNSPILAIVNSEIDRQKIVDYGADIVVLEGLPSAKLANHITTLLQQDSEIKHTN
jgi:DNA-binding NarL/FixJ family response regulator